MNNLNTIKTGYLVGGLSIAFFALYVIWGLILSNPTFKEHHDNILQIMYPGFSYNVLGILIGVVEAFIYGWIFGVLLAWLGKKYAS